MDHVAIGQSSAASAPIGMSASGESRKHSLDQGIAGSDPK